MYLEIPLNIRPGSCEPIIVIDLSTLEDSFGVIGYDMYCIPQMYHIKAQFEIAKHVFI